MTILPLTQASHRLGIDAKTLRRWLVQAHLPLQSDPQDARKKGVRAEHLHLLATLHQRSLAPLSSSPPAQEAASPSPLPAALLALPEQLAALQEQLSALQQQVADLTRLLERPAEPATPPAPPRKTSKRTPMPTPPTPKASPAKAPHKPVHVIPRVEYGKQGQYVVICPKHGLLPIRPDTEEWFAWVKEQDSFRFVGKCGHFTAHHEWRVPKGAWRAHRHIRNHNYILRLAPNHELTLEVLEQVPEALQAHLTSPHT